MDSDLKKNVMSETHGKNCSGNSSQSASTLDSLTRSFTFLLYSSSSTGLLIVVLSHLSVNGNLVPYFIFTTHPYLLRALVIAVMVSFATASSGLLIANNSRHAKICRWYLRISQISMASVFLIVAVSLFLEFLRLVSSGSKLWVNEVADSFVACKYVFQVHMQQPESFNGIYFINPVLCLVAGDFQAVSSSGSKLLQWNDERADSLFLHRYVYGIFSKICPTSEELRAAYYFLSVLRVLWLRCWPEIVILISSNSP